MPEQKFNLGEEVFITDLTRTGKGRTGKIISASLDRREEFIKYGVEYLNPIDHNDKAGVYYESQLIEKDRVDEYVADILSDGSWVKKGEPLKEGAWFEIYVEGTDGEPDKVLSSGFDPVEAINLLIDWINSQEFNGFDPEEENIRLRVTYPEVVEVVEKKEEGQADVATV